ncbi:unnamed protein product, partial [Candidula unifasciata]
APLFCSCRLILSVVSCLGFVCMYSIRFNVVVAMPCIVGEIESVDPTVHSGVKGSIWRPTECMGKTYPKLIVSNATDRPRRVLSGSFYAWDKKIQGAVTGSFFWGYWISQIPGGWLSERQATVLYGGKRFFGWATFGCGMATLLIPSAAHVNYWALIAIRVLLGLLQGVTWPAMFVIWSRWAPPLEREKLMALCVSGATFGIVLTYPTVAILCELQEGGWVYAFYLPGTVTIIWCLFWYYYVYDTPNILSSPAVWAYMIAHSAFNFQLYALMSFTIVYLQDVHYFSEMQAPRLVAIPYIGFFAFCNISAAVYDVVVARKICSRTVARKTSNAIGFLVPALLLIFVGFLNCTHSTLAVFIMVAVNTISGVQYGAGFLLNLQEIAPQHTGVIFGISNTFATFSGLVSLSMTKELTANRLRGRWQITFLIVSALFVLSFIIFTFFGSGELQKWAQPTEGRKDSIPDSGTTASTNEQIAKI